MDILRFFKEELGQEDIKIRVNTIRRLPIIVNTIPQTQEAKDKLMHILVELVTSSEDDEVLFGLAETVHNLQLIFKFQQLLPLLEKMFGCEETVVREKVVDSFVKIV